jgi:hypothetical protein
LLSRVHRDAHVRALAVEIGDEPPLRLDGQSGSATDSRGVNLRWLAGTTLAGVLGGTFLGACILASVNADYRFVETPGVLARWNPMAERIRSTNTTRKGDQIVADRNVDETRTVMRVSTTTRVGDREMVRTRPVTRITANLLDNGIRTDVPKYNPLAIFTEDEAPSSREADSQPADDGDISYVVRDLATIEFPSDAGPAIPLEQVVASVRDVGVIEAVQHSDLRSLALLDGGAPEEAAAPVIAPNMTIIPKRSQAAAGGDQERVVQAREGERLEDILIREGASPEDAAAVARAYSGQSGYGTTGLANGQAVRLLMSQVGARAQPVRVIVEAGGSESIVALSDTGGYVVVADAPEIAEEGEPAGEADEPGNSKMTLYQALYGTALAKNVPEPVIKEMVRVFGYDADFQRRMTRADSFEVLFESDENGAVDGVPEVLFASLSSGGEVRRYYRFQPPGDGGLDYFDESGRSARKFLMRKPVAAGVMRSGFGMRRHPILGMSKMHTGVDWSAPRGTPIYAAGNGVVDRAARTSGYGNQVKLRHANGYETAYSHMNGFARGIKAGVRVRQGQLIGYIGSTGLSTGPHLHYEVLVNGRFVNPMRIKVPRGRELDGAAMAEFQRERERIDGLLGRETTAAQLAASDSEGG